MKAKTNYEVFEPDDNYEHQIIKDIRNTVSDILIDIANRESKVQEIINELQSQKNHIRFSQMKVNRLNKIIDNLKNFL